jgi:hypothetical protein
MSDQHQRAEVSRAIVDNVDQLVPIVTGIFGLGLEWPSIGL